jgi:hypothetical protein
MGQTVIRTNRQRVGVVNLLWIFLRKSRDKVAKKGTFFVLKCFGKSFFGALFYQRRRMCLEESEKIYTSWKCINYWIIYEHLTSFKCNFNVHKISLNFMPLYLVSRYQCDDAYIQAFEFPFTFPILAAFGNFWVFLVIFMNQVISKSVCRILFSSFGRSLSW